MTYGDSGDGGLSRNEGREAAREKAKALRDQHRKKDRRGRALLQGGLVVVVVAIVAGIALVVANGIRPPSPGPLNMQSDGIKIGQKLAAITTPALKPGQTPTPTKTNSKDAIAIQVYLDYQCPVCKSFEKANASQIATWVTSGAATVEIHPISLLDRFSGANKYSTRSANAAACVANYSPNSYFDFSALLFESQPAENSDGLSDDQIIALVKKTKITNLEAVESCITGQSFKSWVNAASSRATTGPITGTDVAKITSTPTVIINGVRYTGALNDARAFAAAILTASGDTFIQASTATPTPTPTP
jgi:protein-disulfide isomerase